MDAVVLIAILSLLCNVGLFLVAFATLIIFALISLKNRTV